ncbi:MAG TPA: hypothetical protein VJX10_09185 [Pseudonocardiaceae bacterium]|nr:hypothetical protein [Pseudonocardiaceae bacterium]
MDTASVGQADSVEGTANTPIFDELAGRFGLARRLAEPVVPARSAEPADEPADAGESVAAG